MQTSTLVNWLSALVIVGGGMVWGGCDEPPSDEQSGGQQSGAEVAGQETDRSAVGPGKEGEPMPDLSAQTLGGETIDLEATGEATLVNLWATWCGPCIAELPEFATLKERWGEEGLRLVGLSIESEDARDKVAAFVDQRQPAFQVRFAPSRDPLAAFEAGSVPATFLYDRQGELVWSHGSMLEAPQLEQLNGHLERLLEE